MVAPYMRCVKDPASKCACVPNCLERDRAGSFVSAGRRLAHPAPFSAHSLAVGGQKRRSERAVVSVYGTFFGSMDSCAVAGEGKEVSPRPAAGARGLLNFRQGPEQTLTRCTKRRRNRVAAKGRRAANGNPPVVFAQSTKKHSYRKAPQSRGWKSAVGVGIRGPRDPAPAASRRGCTGR